MFRGKVKRALRTQAAQPAPRGSADERGSQQGWETSGAGLAVGELEGAEQQLGTSLGSYAFKRFPEPSNYAGYDFWDVISLPSARAELGRA